MTNSVIVKQILGIKKSWSGDILPDFGSGNTEMRVLTFKILPNAKTAIHMHPINGAGYVIRGELTMFSTTDPYGNFSDHKNVKKIQLKAGDAWAETVNTWHYGENKSNEDCEFVLIFAGLEGTPSTLYR